MGYLQEKVTLYSEQNNEITGNFDLHIGKSSIFLVGNPKKIEGIDHLSSIPYGKGSFTMEQGQGITLDEEWNMKQKSILINFLESLLDEIQDEGNRMFDPYSLQENLKRGST